ncbi:putative 60S ribosomal protein L18a-1 [Blattamonas nauphoetae]|uniref:60S ribosomal protein L18a n=1 Tax=Blattamonas nauphoetae TaxID=2049346 RepID=A0ABQ9YHF9_9EUKA|nr:putative 60S ribosomal protein L18a-1 [Blattamonas nauphoetae]KAK2963179.1 putative 60S ribosomal protein L18a-1 [Blattamonas nauphoetae]
MAPTIRQYEIIGRKFPSEKEPSPKVFKMKLFAKNAVVARSRYNYYMSRLHKMKKSHCQILKIAQIPDKKTNTVKNFGILISYDSRTGTHNVYKEYRDVSICGAVEQMYNDMASRHAAQGTTINIISANRIQPKDCKRTAVTAFHDSAIKFPLFHRKQRPSTQDYKTTFKARRPTTVF